MLRFFFAVTFILIALILTPPVLLADTASSRIDLTINQGPGFLLPTSPFYFADILKNNTRLFLATYNRAHKAQVHLQIAGERIAEIKVMLEEKNMPPRALDLALSSLAENIEGARNELKLEKNSGSNIEKLAEVLNTTVNAQKESLRILETKTDEEGSLKIKAKLAKIRETEVEVEDEMAPDNARNEAIAELQAAVEEESQTAAAATIKVLNLSEELARMVPPPVAQATVSGKVSGASDSKKPKEVISVAEASSEAGPSSTVSQ